MSYYNEKLISFFMINYLYENNKINKLIKIILIEIKIIYFIAETINANRFFKLSSYYYANLIYVKFKIYYSDSLK